MNGPIPPHQEPGHAQSLGDYLRTRLMRRLESPQAAFFWRQNKYTILCMLIAFLLAFLVLTIGFAKTLLLVFFLGVGYLIGAWRDRKPIILELIRRFR